jgi:hypothetical protein
MKLYNLMDLFLISGLFISSFGLSVFISNGLYAPACIPPLHITFLILLVYSVYSVY